jgi:proteasome accessory factor B
MDRLERLINLTAALLDTDRPLTRRELHDRVPGYADDPDVFRRAFERDKDSLRSMGVPISVEKISNNDADSIDGYRIRKEDYELPDAGFTPDELRALHVAVAAVQLTSSDGTSGLQKLGGTLGDDEVINLTSMEASAQLPRLFESVSKHAVVQFNYNDSKRTVEPHRLTHYRGRWYLAAFDRDKNDVRSFRVDRIEGDVTQLSEEFSPPLSTTSTNYARPWDLGDEDPVAIRLYVDSTQVDWVETQLGADADREVQADGGAIFTTTIVNKSAFRSFVLGLLDHAELLEPQEMRSDIVGWLREFAV